MKKELKITFEETLYAEDGEVEWGVVENLLRFCDGEYAPQKHEIDIVMGSLPKRFKREELLRAVEEFKYKHISRTGVSRFIEK